MHATDRADVHEVAEPAACAFVVFILAAARLAEVRHGRQLRDQRAARKPALVEVVHRLLRSLLLLP